MGDAGHAEVHADLAALAVEVGLDWSKMYCLSCSLTSALFLTVLAYTPYSCSAARVSSPVTSLNLSAFAWQTGHSAGGCAPS